MLILVSTLCYGLTWSVNPKQVHKYVFTATRVVQGGGGVSGTVHGRKKSRITDPVYQNVIFTNHENKQVSCFFHNLLLR